jgi:heme-degrading monooxygenase HmoA
MSPNHHHPGAPVASGSGEDGTMSYVVINAISVTPGLGPELERRFAGRAGAVDQAAGFENFALLRPDMGTDTYLVYTQWASKQDFEAWQSSPQFGHGHRGARGAQEEGAAAPAPVTTANEVWGFEIVGPDAAA